MSIAGVQARIAQLQSGLGTVSGQPATTAATTTASSQFSSVLADQLGNQGSPPAGAPVGGGSALRGPWGTLLGGPSGQGLLGGPAAPLASAPTGGVTAAGGPAGTAAPGSGAALVESAEKYLGVPYVWGGESLSEGGLDCSGLVQLAMKDIGVDVPRVAREQMKLGTEVPSLAQARPGDLVVTRGGGHIGIYVGGNKWIHAPYPGEKVKLAEMTTPPTTIRRVLPS